MRAQSVNLPGFVQPSPFAQEDMLDYDLSSTQSFIQPSEEEILAEPSKFKVPLLVRINRLLQLGLVALCALAILSYSLDVVMSYQVTAMQEQVQRLTEQNSELSAKLLKSVSFQGIQDSVMGGVRSAANLHVPDEVLIASEVAPVKAPPFKPGKYHLPLLSGY